MGYTDIFAGAFNGKTVLLSGGTSGIGLALAKGFADCGATVIATGSSASRLQEAQAHATDRLSFERLDVQDKAAVEARFGELTSLDVLVNCQGVARPGDEWNEETFLAVMDINLNSAMRLSRAAHPLLKASGGSILNIASMLSYLADPSVPSYTASKSGLAGITRLLACEWAARGINVNGIAPGYFATNNTEALRADETRNRDILVRIPAGRWGDPSDLAGAAVFLASDAAAYVHGTILPVDGGWLAR